MSLPIEDLFKGYVSPDPEKVFRNSSFTHENPTIDLDTIVAESTLFTSPLKDGDEVLICHSGRGNIRESYLGIIENGKYKPLAEITQILLPDRLDTEGHVIETNRGYSCDVTKLTGSIDSSKLTFFGSEYKVYQVPKGSCKLLLQLGVTKIEVKEDVFESPEGLKEYVPKPPPPLSGRSSSRYL